VYIKELLMIQEMRDEGIYISGGFRGQPPFLLSQEIKKNECIDIKTQ